MQGLRASVNLIPFNSLPELPFTTPEREKVERLQEIIPPLHVFGPKSGSLLVVSWGSVYGAARSAVSRALADSIDVAHVHLRYLNPLPSDLLDIMRRYQRILIPELNMGQLALLLRGQYALTNIISLPKVQGRPFTIHEIYEQIRDMQASSNGKKG